MKKINFFNFISFLVNNIEKLLKLLQSTSWVIIIFFPGILQNIESSAIILEYLQFFEVWFILTNFLIFFRYPRLDLTLLGYTANVPYVPKHDNKRFYDNLRRQLYNLPSIQSSELESSREASTILTPTSNNIVDTSSEEIGQHKRQLRQHRRHHRQANHRHHPSH